MGSAGLQPLVVGMEQEHELGERAGSPTHGDRERGHSAGSSVRRTLPASNRSKSSGLELLLASPGWGGAQGGHNPPNPA